MVGVGGVGFGGRLVYSACFVVVWFCLELLLCWVFCVLRFMWFDDCFVGFVVGWWVCLVCLVCAS